VDSYAFSEKLKTRSLLRSRVKEPRKPSKGGGKAAAIRELDHKLVVRDRDFPDPGIDARH
jgi:hypothetical protein